MVKYFLLALKPWNPLRAICSVCEVETVFSGFTRIRTDDPLPVILHEYQCQDCGQLTFSDENIAKYELDESGNEVELIRVALDRRCGCSGQYRRDQNIFCPICFNRKGNSINASTDFINVNVFNEVLKFHNK